MCNPGDIISNRGFYFGVKKKLIIGGLILLAAVGFLFYTSFRDSTATDYTVTQLFDKGNSVLNKPIRVTGNVSPGSVEQKTGDLNMKFTVSDGGKTLPVVYKGVVPDTFKEGNPIVVEGTLDASGVFQATTLMVKCPSKYAPTTPAAEAPRFNGINSWLI